MSWSDLVQVSLQIQKERWGGVGTVDEEPVLKSGDRSDDGGIGLASAQGLAYIWLYNVLRDFGGWRT